MLLSVIVVLVVCSECISMLLFVSEIVCCDGRTRTWAKRRHLPATEFCGLGRNRDEQAMDPQEHDAAAMVSSGPTGRSPPMARGAQAQLLSDEEGVQVQLGEKGRAAGFMLPGTADGSASDTGEADEWVV